MLTRLKKKYFEHKYTAIFAELEKHIAKNSRVLDVGCGNMILARRLAESNHSSVTGIDVVDVVQDKSLKFVQYDGKNIPFPDKSFDISYAVFVLHHIKPSEPLVQEMVRVTKKKIIILEPVYSNWLQKQLLKLFDLTNLFDSLSIPLPFTFKTARDNDFF